MPWVKVIARQVGPLCWVGVLWNRESKQNIHRAGAISVILVCSRRIFNYLPMAFLSSIADFAYRYTLNFLVTVVGFDQQYRGFFYSAPNSSDCGTSQLRCTFSTGRWISELDIHREGEIGFRSRMDLLREADLSDHLGIRIGPYIFDGWLV